MAYLLIRHKVKDYAKWKILFDEHGAKRKSGGSKGRQRRQPEERKTVLSTRPTEIQETGPPESLPGRSLIADPIAAPVLLAVKNHFCTKNLPETVGKETLSSLLNMPGWRVR